ncbi:SEL1-like repeat protein [Francisella tularensis]|uniref:hypothetical protein n=1 Tax=Francisella tularensis TaxID=263 RepID=UPI001C0EFE6E|nr:hypothetical protein [Francisella tularensis]MBK2109886.1 hypothetical protein [Francisella tularensis subsp. novicida FSC595]
MKKLLLVLALLPCISLADCLDDFKSGSYDKAIESCKDVDSTSNINGEYELLEASSLAGGDVSKLKGNQRSLKKKVMGLLEQSSRKGNSEATTLLGFMYMTQVKFFNEQGYERYNKQVAENNEIAKKLFKKASEQGYLPAKQFYTLLNVYPHFFEMGMKDNKFDSSIRMYYFSQQMQKYVGNDNFISLTNSKALGFPVIMAQMFNKIYDSAGVSDKVLSISPGLCEEISGNYLGSESCLDSSHKLLNTFANVKKYSEDEKVIEFLLNTKG